MSSKAAKIAYRPVGLVTGMLGGLVAGAIFKRVWGAARDQDPPDPMQSEFGWREMLTAAAIQGVIYAVVKAAIDRGGARAFERWTGEWPGN